MDARPGARARSCRRRRRRRVCHLDWRKTGGGKGQCLRVSSSIIHARAVNPSVRNTNANAEPHGSFTVRLFIFTSNRKQHHRKPISSLRRRAHRGKEEGEGETMHTYTRSSLEVVGGRIVLALSAGKQRFRISTSAHRPGARFAARCSFSI